MIYNLAVYKLGNRENAEDITQECFLRAYKMLRTYRIGAAFSTWQYRICQNLIRDFYRENKKWIVAEVSLYIQDAAGEFRERDISYSSHDPTEIILKDEKIQVIRALIQSLPDDLRDIVIMRDINNLSYIEIAEALGIGVGTVKSKIYRAREKLKKCILENNKADNLF